MIICTQNLMGATMKVGIKSFDVNMEVKNNGIEFEVYDNDDKFRGDLIVTKKGVIWCEGRKRRKNGVAVSWNEFIDWMNG